MIKSEERSEMSSRGAGALGGEGSSSRGFLSFIGMAEHPALREIDALEFTHECLVFRRNAEPSLTLLYSPASVRSRQPPTQPRDTS